MNDILINVISVLVTTVVLPLISIGGTQLIKLINSKIKNNKASKLLATATEIVINAVRSVFQTYVESLKESGKFDAQCQVTALNKAKEVALHQMTSDVTGYITETYGDVDSWLTIQIEATINTLKNR